MFVLWLTTVGARHWYVCFFHFVLHLIVFSHPPLQIPDIHYDFCKELFHRLLSCVTQDIADKDRFFLSLSLFFVCLFCACRIATASLRMYTPFALIKSLSKQANLVVDSIPVCRQQSLPFGPAATVTGQSLGS